MSNSDNETPASSHFAESWHEIDWETSHLKVRGLQVRIAKAAKEKQWRKVSQLQRMLINSFSAKAIAIKRITENRGRKTVGIDGETWGSPKSKWSAIARLSHKGYKPKPLRRVYIPKSNGDRRPLGIPTMLDRGMQALYLLAFEPVTETCADRNSYGFRPLRSAADAIEQLFVNLSRKSSSQWVLEGDIKGCFDNISHEWLIQNVPLDMRVVRKWLKAGYLESGQINKTEAGTPQGGIISPLLANWALDGLESVLESHFGKKNTKAAYKTKVNYVRYADDFVITGISKELLEERVKPVVVAFMAERGLSLSKEKTLITHIDDGFDFLGQNLRKYKGKLLTKPSYKNLKAVLAKIKNIFTRYKTVPAWLLIRKLNPIIRGWANYHKGGVSKETFKYLDYRIWKMLWQWCRRRHANRQKRWVVKKYFKSVKKRNWTFFGVPPDKGDIHLIYASDTKIVRHRKIIGTANPYDPIDEMYFEKRLEYVLRQSDMGLGKAYRLSKRQQCRCPCCNQLMTKETGWNIHHVIERHKGGSDKMDNLVLLHPNCHRQLHACNII